jgi:hypothetical protein
LQLEPSSLRQPDHVAAPPKLGTDGSHLPATLYHLARQKYQQVDQTSEVEISQVYSQVGNALHSSSPLRAIAESGDFSKRKKIGTQSKPASRFFGEKA